MYFWCICGEEGDLHILLLHHLEGLSPSYVFSKAFFLLLSFLSLKSQILFFRPQVNRIGFIIIFGLWPKIITVHWKELSLKNIFVCFNSVISTLESTTRQETNIISPCGLLSHSPACSTQATYTKSCVDSSLPSFLPSFFPPSFPSFFLSYMVNFTRSSSCVFFTDFFFNSLIEYN